MTGPLLLDGNAVQRLLPEMDVLGAIRDMFQALGTGSVTQPPQAKMEFMDGSGDMIAYLAASSDHRLLAAKLSPYIAGGAGAVVTAWTVLMSARTGLPLMLCDAGQLTIERTAATTALAVSLLAPEEAATLAVIGLGAAAVAHLRCILPLRAWTSVCAWSPSGRPRVGLPEGVTIGRDLCDTVCGAEVILLCTSSAAPVLDPRHYPQARLITSISTNAPDAHEIAPESLPELEVWCDFSATTPFHAAEMRLAQQHGWSTAMIVGDLGELVTGCKHPRSDRTQYFRSLGLGCEDLAVAAELFRVASSRGLTG